MSRVGKYPIAIPAGVTVSVTGQDVKVKGKLGEMSFQTTDEISVSTEGGKLWVKPLSDSQKARAMWGTTRARLNNMIKGVSVGFSKKMEMLGVGYKAQVQGKTLKMSLGFSHDVNFAIPEGIKIVAVTPTTLEISGVDKQLIGQVAANIRVHRPPEPYKGKGIKYEGEQIRRKAGKKK